MRYSYLISVMCVVLLMSSFLSQVGHFLYAEDISITNITEKRKHLAAVPKGTSAKEVDILLGKPDEIRTLPNEGNLDGMRLVKQDPVTKQDLIESKRWCYGILGKGMFTAVGFVSLDKNERVVGAVSTDYFCQPKKYLPFLMPAISNSALKTPTGLFCSLGEIEEVTNRGVVTPTLKTVVTVHNEGNENYELKHPAAISIRTFLIIEIYDAKTDLIFRDDNLRYSSFHPSGREHVLLVPANEKMADDLSVSPSRGFGPLPSGVYYMRVYFPLITARTHQQNQHQSIDKNQQPHLIDEAKVFDKAVANWEYYPSNLVRFEVKGRQASKP